MIHFNISYPAIRRYKMIRNLGKKKPLKIGNAQSLINFVKNICKQRKDNSKPLTICVDLDGTLLKDDSTVGAFRYFLKNKIYMLPILFFWLLYGKAFLKHKVGQYVPNYSVDLYKYNLTILRLLIELKRKGHYIVMATAADIQIATLFAKKINLFNEVIASNKNEVYKGHSKATILNKKFGENNYIYIGDSFNDLPIWPNSCGAIIVSEDYKLIKTIEDKLKKPFIFAVNKWQSLKTGPLIF